MEYQIADFMKETITDKKSFLRKETCWVASNIICGPVSNGFMVLNKLLEHIVNMYLYDEPKIMTEASWVILNATQKMNEKTVDLMLKHDVLGCIEKKIELEELSEDQQDVILTFLEEFLKRTMRFKIHKDLKDMIRASKIMDFVKPLAYKRKENDLGMKAYDIIARYFKDVKEEMMISIASSTPNNELEEENITT